MTHRAGAGSRFEVFAPSGVPEVGSGDDLAELLVAVSDLRDGDIVVVTSKVVSKAEGRVRPGGRDDVLGDETVRVVARRGATSIVRTRHGLTMAAAGIDASNVAAGHIVLLPLDPDASARDLRAALRDRTGHNVGVVVTDTAGRAWRNGQTDIAVGAAGVAVSHDLGGQVDTHGNLLEVTEPALADEIAGAAELAKGKLGGRPFAVVRGLPELVLPVGDPGHGAVALVRDEGSDMFGYGAREAVVRALTGNPVDRPAFGVPAPVTDLTAALIAVLGVPIVVEPEPPFLALVAPSPEAELVVRALCFAHGWTVVEPVADTAGSSRAFPRRLRLSPLSP